PVDEDVVGGAVVLDLVHAHPGDLALWGPVDDNGRGGELGHAYSGLVGLGVAAAGVGLDGGGHVGRTRFWFQLGVVMGRWVDHELHLLCGLPGCVGCDAREHPRVLDGGGVDVERPVLVAGGARRVADHLAVGADPVGGRLGVADVLTAQAHALTFHHEGLGAVAHDHGRLTRELLLLDGPEVLAGQLPG
ncbi:hypothetical protein AALO_G00204730, partial [Alosa alosa]